MKYRSSNFRLKKYIKRTIELLRHADLYYRLVALFLAIILWFFAAENL